MRVLQLKAENIKRLSAIDITPGDGLVVIAGRNAQGKSSVLDAIAMALGGVRLVPKQPIKDGAARGEVVVDLGDYIVTRVFSRDRAACDCENGAGAVQHLAACASLTKWSPTSSVLKVKSRENASFPSPQAMLDKMVGELAFDPLAFLKLKPAEQDATLRRLAGIDTTNIDGVRLTAFNERTDANRNLKALEARLAAMPKHADAPAELVTVEELNQEIKAAAILRNEAAAATLEANNATVALGGAQAQLRSTVEEVEQLRLKIDMLKVRLVDEKRQLEEAAVRADAAARAEVLAQAAVPETEAMQRRLQEADEANRKVRENTAWLAVEQERALAELAADGLTKLIAEADKEKAAKLAAAKFPVAGLALSDDGPMFNGQLMAQASTAERLRVSVAMGLALNPKLKVLLVHEGNDLDEDGLKLLGQLAAEHEAQVWLERIAGGGDGVTVVIEDGTVKA